MKFTDKSQSARTITKDGFLFVPAKISKTGVFEYHASELGLNDGQIKRVARTEKSLFSDRTLKSFEGAPITIGHPEEGVNSKNWKNLAVGNAKNIARVGDELTAELWVYDEAAIKLIQEKGIEELSCGYDCNLIDTEVEDADFEMSPMIGNHIAIVAKGRCGSTVKIADEDKTFMSKTVKLLDGILSAFGIKLSDEQKKAVQEEEQKTDKTPDNEGEKTANKEAEKGAKAQPEGKKAQPDEGNEKEKKTVKDAALVKENADLKAEIQRLKDEAAKAETEQKRTAVLADAQANFANVKFADNATVREICESAVVSSGIFSQDEAKKLSDEELSGAYKTAKATAKKLADRNLGAILIGDSAKTAQAFDFNSYSEGAK